MRRPSQRLIIAFFVSLLIGYVLSWITMVFILAAPFRLYGFTNLTVVALLVAALLLLFLDSPLKLGVFDWPKPDPARKGKKEQGYRGLLDWLTTVDHKKIGLMYFLFSFFRISGQKLFYPTFESEIISQKVI